MKFLFAFFSDEFQWLVESTKKNVDSICLNQCVDSNELIHAITSFMPDEVIFLNNLVVSHNFAYQIILDVIRRCNVKINCLYPFYVSHAKKLISAAEKHRVLLQLSNIIDGDYNKKGVESLSLSVPVLYISGMTNFCEQIRTHSIISNILFSSGIPHVNLTNSSYSDILCYYHLDSFYSSNSKNQILSRYFSQIVEEINKKIKKIIEKEKPQLIIISDEYGVNPFNMVMNNNYGLNNSILRYAIPYDYVLFCVYAQRYSQKSLCQIINNISCQTLSTNIQIAMAHVFLDIMHEKLSAAELSLKIINSDYQCIMNDNCNISEIKLIDSLSQIELNKYLDSLK